MNGINIRVQLADAFDIDVDVLVLKYAQYPFGLDEMVIEKLEPHFKIKNFLPEPAEYYHTESKGVTVAKEIIFIGTPPLENLHYKEVRDFSRSALAALFEVAPGTQKIAMTMHGVGYGLDESESFVSLIAGIVDAINSGSYPHQLEEIVIVEIKERRVRLAQALLSTLFPNGQIPAALHILKQESNEILRSAGYISDKKKSIFVAMPFSSEFDDIYHYGILGSVKTIGYLCERADFASFTGNIMRWVKERIESSELVIADLTTANSNVYLEVGYAWGIGKPTILLTQDEKDLQFDVRDQKCIVYSKIIELEKKLTKELKELLSLA